ncbi:MAG TPA: hypothetical protein VFT68_14770 [Lapillicoccus sp.]|nr:hypothetical protein [Lapillicoccus sp.]
MRQRTFGRRALLLGAAGVGLAGCTDPPAATSTGSAPATTGIPETSTTTTTTTTSTTSTTPTPTPTTSALPPLPASRVYPIAPNEPEPVAKEKAVRLVEATSAWGVGGSGEASVAAKLTAQGISAARAATFAAATAPFRGASPEATSGVIAVQYGGLTATSASLLVTFEQWTRDAAGAVVRSGAGADVRLAREGGQWQVSEVFAATPLPPVQPLPALVAAVLANGRIRLPPAAAADIAAGNLRPKPMQALLDLARDYDIDVSIVFKPHPDNVFATNRLSDHTRRRAWDIWAVNGQAVIAESTPDALIDGFLRDAKDAGAYNIGGPRLLSGAGYFSDRTHRDHCHIAFNSDT